MMVEMVKANKSNMGQCQKNIQTLPTAQCTHFHMCTGLLYAQESAPVQQYERRTISCELDLKAEVKRRSISWIIVN